MNKKQKIINKIEQKEENWYRTATKEYLSKYSKLNSFQIALYVL